MPSAAFRPVNPASEPLHELAVPLLGGARQLLVLLISSPYARASIECNGYKPKLAMKKLLLLATITLAAINAFTQGTLFTYQGRLNDNGGPASGNYDLQFTLCDAPTGGIAVASPITNASTAVSNGLFTVMLDFGGSVFDGADRWLEIGVRTNGGGAFTTLVPRQQITATPYAITAGNVTGSVAAGQIVGTLGAANLAPGAAAANLAAGGQGGVAATGLVLSETDDNAPLVAAGYVKLGTIQSGETWQLLTNGTSPAPRKLHTVVWTGTEMIIWGGANGSTNFNDGGRYNPTTKTWTTISTNGAPSGRYYHTAVWTGGEMIVWGGLNGSSNFNDGARYNPTSNTWTPIATNGSPVARYSHTAVWTGSEMIIWGGWNGASNFNSGGRYNPTANTWLAVTTNVAPTARYGHAAVWTGGELIVWGGRKQWRHIE